MSKQDFGLVLGVSCELPDEYIEKYGVDVADMLYTIEGVSYKGYKGELSNKEFYDKVRAGSMPTTHQVNPEEAARLFEKHLKAGRDVLHIAFSSGLSGSVNSARLAQEELSAKYPDRRIVVIDSLCAAQGEGLLDYYACEMKAQGKSLDEIAQWVEENKMRVNHFVTVDDLNHLHRGGRVSRASAVLGGLIGIKPMLYMDNEGKLQVYDKIRGRKASIEALVDMMVKKTKGMPPQKVFIGHGDALEEAEQLKALVMKKTNCKDFVITYIGPVIGSHTGQGVLALFFLADNRDPA